MTEIAPNSGWLKEYVEKHPGLMMFDYLVGPATSKDPERYPPTTDPKIFNYAQAHPGKLPKFEYKEPSDSRQSLGCPLGLLRAIPIVLADFLQMSNRK
jgi:hypothetical protein